MSNRSVRVIIEGRVQGVWFRGWTVKLATELCLSGWVRNRRDGSVEAIFCGDENSLEKIIKLLYHGPEAASVVSVNVKYEDINVEEGFEQLPTL
ncbi:MAG: acylphosphatase [Pseudomonadota bacterium]|nr:acylphosphatase [Pseudomonadota bacterium]